MKIEMEFRWPRMLQSRLQRFGVVALVTLFALGVPSALAVHDFTDVPDDHPFHAEISALKGSGITGGKTCVPPGTPPTFCPNEPVVRQGMAAFLHRGLSRVAHSNVILDPTIPFSATEATDTLVGDVTINVGGAGAGVNQFVEIEGQVTLGDNMTDGGGTIAPPYVVTIYLAEGDHTLPENRSPRFLQMIRNVDLPNDTVPISWVRAAAPGPHTYKLYAWAGLDADGAQALAERLALTVTTHAFGSTGGSTLNTTPSNEPRSGR